MKLSMRKYQSEDDYHQIRRFLRDVFLLNGCRELSWQRYRLDYWHWHGSKNLNHGRLEDDVFIWETDRGEIGAVLNRESPGSVFLQVHPELSTPAVEEEMIAVAEEHLTVVAADGQRKLGVWALENDTDRQSILVRRGYEKSQAGDWQRYRSLAEAVPDRSLPDGYVIRSLEGDHELPARAYLSWCAFHPNDPPEDYQGWESYRNIQAALLYRLDLDLVVVAPNGDLASFGTIWFDEDTGCAAFEPMGTAPEYQRLGLAAALMSAGLRRLKQLGASRAFVGSWNEATHKLYGEMVGFRDYDLMQKWVKRGEAIDVSSWRLEQKAVRPMVGSGGLPTN